MYIDAEGTTHLNMDDPSPSMFKVEGSNGIASRYPKYDYVPKFNYCSNEEEVIDGYINYHLYDEKGVTAIQIFNSYKITSLLMMEKILRYIIGSEKGKELGLSLDDLNYYIKEWRAHNLLYNIFTKSSNKFDDIFIDNAKHVDLNTNDGKRIIYKIIGVY